MISNIELNSAEYFTNVSSNKVLYKLRFLEFNLIFNIQSVYCEGKETNQSPLAVPIREAPFSTVDAATFFVVSTVVWTVFASVSNHN